MLTPEERRWLNAYHAWILDTLSSKLDDSTRDWLQNATQAI
jgi:Xaa-Pro aminopeptidase